MNFKNITEGLKSIEELFYPSVCFFCKSDLSTDRKIICRPCWYDLPKYSDDNFERYLPKLYRNLFILYRYDSNAGHLIHLLKYERRFSLAAYFAESILNNFPQLTSDQYHHLMPVPLYKTRKRERGYNQSDIVCRALYPLTGIDYETDILVRTRNTKSQTNLNREQRQDNVNAAFQCRQPVNNENILLMDDVVTTGSTINACANALKEAGAKNVDVIILAG